MPSGQRQSSYASFDGRLVHELGQASENGRVCMRWHSVPKVEYMTRPPSGTPENSPGLGLDPLPRREQHCRVEVALHATLVADFFLAPIERDTPVEADHIAACRGHLAQQRRR